LATLYSSSYSLDESEISLCIEGYLDLTSSSIRIFFLFKIVGLLLTIVFYLTVVFLVNPLVIVFGLSLGGS